MDARSEHEADLFRRYESRIVKLEGRCDDFDDYMQKWTPVVEKLRDAELIATALAAKLDLARRGALSKWQIAVAVCALFVPPMLTMGLTLLLLKR